jgi:hypothetical protein
MRYFVLNLPGRDEVVRLSRGVASYLDTATGRWIPDPLLAVEVHATSDWREISATELPPGVAEVTEDGPGRHRTRTSRRGRRARR